MITLSKLQESVINYPSDKMVVSLGVGLGKTIATLSAHKDVEKILIVMPKMLKEEKTWEKNHEKLGSGSELYTISKENFRKHHKTLPHFDCIVLDEYASWAVGVSPTMRSKYGKEYIVSSQMHDAVMWYVKQHRPSKIYLVDATASANKAMALWATKRILGTLSKIDMDSFLAFRSIFYTKIQKGYRSIYLEKKDKKTTELLSKLWRETGVFLDDVNRIPPIETVVDIEMTQEQERVLDQISRDYTDPMVLHLKEYMCLNGVYKTTEFDEIEHKTKEVSQVVDNLKAEYIAKYAYEKRKPIIVFATFTTQIHSIVETLRNNGIDSNSITGKTENKSEVADSFRNGEIQVLVVQSSICQGWEAPYCDTIIRASMPRRADHAIQQAGRIDRPHIISKQNYIINLVIPDTVDEKAYKTIKKGENLHWMTVDLDN